MNLGLLRRIHIIEKPIEHAGNDRTRNTIHVTQNNAHARNDFRVNVRFTTCNDISNTLSLMHIWKRTRKT